MSRFTKATKEKSRLRLALMGPSGSGKTFTALTFAKVLGAKVAVIDSERGSASKYADMFEFDTCDLESHSPQTYIDCIREAEKAGYDVLIIDSLTHAWSGKEGALEQVDKVAKRSGSGNSFTAWREVTPQHNALVDAMIGSRCHIIATMRTKQEYVLEENEKGKKVPRKIGMAPIQRDGMEYEFDVTADMNLDHDLIVSKTRCAQIDGYVGRKPGAEFAEILREWVTGGVEPQPKKPPEKPPEIVRPSKAQMERLLTAGKHNGWTQKQISEFVCFAFNLKADDFVQKFTLKQWELALGVVTHPTNRNGVVVVSGGGKELPADKKWPKQ